MKKKYDIRIYGCYLTSECNSFQSTAAESKQKLNWVDHTIIWPVLLISSRYIRVDLYALIEAEGCMREPSLSWSDHIACNHQIRELCRECYPNKILQYGNCKTSTWTTWQKSLQTRHIQWIDKSKTFLARINETQWNSMKLNEIVQQLKFPIETFVITSVTCNYGQPALFPWLYRCILVLQWNTMSALSTNQMSHTDETWNTNKEAYRQK